MSWDDAWAPLHWDGELSSQKGSRMAVAATFMLHMYDCLAQSGGGGRGGGWEWEYGKAMKRKKERVSVLWISFILTLLLIFLSQRNERYRRSSSSQRHTYQLSTHSSHETTFFFLLTFFLLSSLPNKIHFTIPQTRPGLSLSPSFKEFGQRLFESFLVNFFITFLYKFLYYHLMLIFSVPKSTNYTSPRVISVSYFSSNLS